ncbi:MAG TPA: indole-3-glycerol phosphate synthase TrpC [Bryobacteraceae bacterium]|jgi:indole-3-glycerol phosphate synthase|nr:indole-3-glycerol phosphate synthase TrpC [Bryobacteraceae bacterium]
MAVVVPDILARIVDHKRTELRNMSQQRAELERAAAHRKDVRNFRAALIQSPPAIISEIKKASPSKGVLLEVFDPAAIATLYSSGGAAALSVLTDREFFKGSLDDLHAARTAVGLPVLRKDFTIDEIHVIEGAAHGADAILLIAALLDESQLRRFRELAEHYNMAALVEVHGEEELNRALASGASIVGVNNRNLHTFEVTLETSLRLAEKIPSGIIKVTESGIHSSADIKRLTDSGFNAFLVGEHLMKSADRSAALRELRS